MNQAFIVTQEHRRFTEFPTPSEKNERSASATETQESVRPLARHEKVKGSIPLGGSIRVTRPLPWILQVSGCSGFQRVSSAVAEAGAEAAVG
jgi:hypothetical protein